LKILFKEDCLLSIETKLTFSNKTQVIQSNKIFGAGSIIECEVIGLGTDHPDLEFPDGSIVRSAPGHLIEIVRYT
jgi:hypothetical protein